MKLFACGTQRQIKSTIKSQIMKQGLFLFFFFLLSCKGEKKTTGEISFMEPIPVVDSLFMQMPGEVYFVNNYIIIEDALGTDNFYKIYDTSGSFVKAIVSSGNSSVEFSTPSLTLLENNDIIVSDLNRGNAIIYKNGFDSLYQYKDLSPKLLKKSSLKNLHDDFFLTLNNDFNSEIEELFSIYNNDSLVQSFGKFPIFEKDINKYDAYQGFLGYNKINGQLIYFSYRIPYYAIYKKNGNNFELAKENNYGKFDYSVNNGNLKVELPDNTPIVSEVALLKDYIVTLGNTEEDLKEIPAPSGRARDFSRLPRSLFLYDYDLNLIKVISLKTSILRLTSNINSNLLYLATYIDGEFNLSKLNLE